jgi:hypothetical protein
LRGREEREIRRERNETRKIKRKEKENIHQQSNVSNQQRTMAGNRKKF